MEINRDVYLERLIVRKHNGFIKVITGIRRCGKSYLLNTLFYNHLKSENIPEDHIIMKKYTEMDIPDTITAKQMYDELVSRVEDDKRYYFLLDEIQEIKGWEKAVNSLLEGMNADIYVTGSNSKLMSSEISTYLTGRYISIPVFTLSFREYLEFKKQYTQVKDIHAELADYIRLGGFPATHLREYSQDEV